MIVPPPIKGMRSVTAVTAAGPPPLLSWPSANTQPPEEPRRHERKRYYRHIRRKVGRRRLEEHQPRRRRHEPAGTGREPRQDRHQQLQPVRPGVVPLLRAVGIPRRVLQLYLRPL